MPKITKEEVESFLHGSNPMERIVKIECGYDDNKAAVYYRDENGKKQVQMDDFFPFCWAKQSAARRLYNGNRDRIKGKMAEYGISCRGLRTQKDDGTEPERMKNGYRVLFYANHPMTYQSFQRFFEEGGVPLSSRKKDGTIGEEERNYVTVSPNEQYMIWTGKRLFKGYEDYDELVRMQWDLETTGLDPQKDIIEQIGLHTNKGFEKIIPITGTTREERLKSQRDAMLEQYHIMREIDPDVMSGYNSENFDWYFEEEQWKKYGTTLQDASATELRFGAYKRKRESILKLGGEMERYRPTIVGSINITDGLHAVRRAMALDSNIKSATLKNISKDFNLKKPNRVYVPGLSISDIYNDNEEHYAFCETDGDWYLYQPNDDEEEESSFTLEYFQKLLDNDKEIVDEATGEILVERSYDENETAEHLLQLHTSKNKKNPSEGFKKGFDGNKFTMYKRSVLLDDYKLVSGRFIVERYLMDDLYETDAVELQFNQSNFQVGKLLPVSYERAATMGTAGIWKYIMLAWSFEHDLAIPEAENVKLEVGGLSRLLRTGAVGSVGENKIKGIKTLKADYNSLYPSIMITFHYQSEVDIDDVMLTMLEYVLTQREHYKGEKGRHGKKADAIKKRLETETLSESEREKLKKELKQEKFLKGKFDKLQLPFKILGNSIFGSVSSNVFYWNSSKVGHQTTCTGRQMFRLLLGKFEQLGYIGVVGDSVTGDTPLFVKNDKTGFISIVPIASLFDSKNSANEGVGREYCFPEQEYKVLCRSGWVVPKYIYRHDTTKPIYEITDGDMRVECTEDHSLFDDKHEEVHPMEIYSDTKLEYYKYPIESETNAVYFEDYEITELVKTTISNTSEYAVIPELVLNASEDNKKLFVETFIKEIEEKNLKVENISKSVVAGIQFMTKGYL